MAKLSRARSSRRSGRARRYEYRVQVDLRQAHKRADVEAEANIEAYAGLVRFRASVRGVERGQQLAAARGAVRVASAPMNDNPEIEAARNVTLQKIGRNVVNLGKMEGMLKYIVTFSRLNAISSGFEAYLAQRVTKVSRMTMGVLVE